MAAIDPRPLLPEVASEDSIRAGAAESQADICPADQQAGRIMEGESSGDAGGPGEAWCR